MIRNWKRRNFIINGAKTLGLVAFSQSFPGFFQRVFAAGSTEEPHYFVLLRASGGAHTALGLDPIILDQVTKRKIDPISIDTGDRGTDKFYAAYRDSDLIDTNGLVLGIAADPLVSHIKDLAIVNGIMLLPQSPFHEVCRRYISTGRSDDNTPLFPFQLGQELGTGPVGVAYNGFEDQDLKQRYFGTPISDIRNQSFESRSAGVGLLESKLKTQGKTGGLSDAAKAVIDSSKKMQNFNEFYQSYRGMAQSDELAVLASGFNSGVIRFASIDLNFNGTLDTHFDHANGHPLALRSVFQQFADIISLFKQIKSEESSGDRSLFENTTFMLTSDFARSSWRQGTDGTDHNPLNNSVLLAGKNILGGQKIGASTVLSPKVFSNEGFSRLQALPFNYNEGRPLTLEEIAVDEQNLIVSADGKSVVLGKHCSRTGGGIKPCVDFITPGSVLKTVAMAFGLDNGTKYLENEKIIPGLVKS